MPQSYQITLGIATVATQTVTVPAKRIEVMNLTGASGVDFIVVPEGDATNPTVGGDNQWKLPAAIESRVVKGHDDSWASGADANNVDVKLISAAATDVVITVLED